MFLRDWHSGWQWLQDTIASNAQNFVLKILAAGPIPKHIAFVMDGNRRYARMNHKEVQQGHSDGFTALRSVSCCNQAVLLTQSYLLRCWKFA
jgi:undecaprenyl pyrophosphate synthase